VSNERGTNFHCSNWCNIRGAGVGTLPTTTIPADTNGVVDAYLRLKTGVRLDRLRHYHLETPRAACLASCW